MDNRRTTPTALGYLCGIGSMLIGARSAGFKILGNYDNRKFMVPDTFINNFEGAFFTKSGQDMVDMYKKRSPTLLVGHPPCGNFSHLTCSAKNIKDLNAKRKDPGEIPSFINAVKEIEPEFFIMENLPKSIKAFPLTLYHELLGESYDLWMNVIENGDYGNPQKHRKRFFVIGSKKSQNFIFKPIEIPLFPDTVKNRIEDLPMDKDIPKINHIHIDLDEVANIYFGVNSDGTTKKYTYRKIKEILLSLPPGKTPTYIAKDGSEKKKIGVLRLYWDKHSHTITGGGWRRAMNKFHPLTGEPLTIREILRIQGAPDDFIIHGPLEDQIPQVGKFIAVEFPTFVCSQIKSHLEKENRK